MAFHAIQTVGIVPLRSKDKARGKYTANEMRLEVHGAGASRGPAPHASSGPNSITAASFIKKCFNIAGSERGSKLVEMRSKILPAFAVTTN